VEAGDSFEIVAGARHVQHHRAAEAVTDGADLLRIDRGLLGELACAALKRDSIVFGSFITPPASAPASFGLSAVLGVAEHVGDEGGCSPAARTSSPRMGVRGDSPPFMHHDDPGPLGCGGVVVDDEALHGGRAVRIGDRHFLDLGPGGRGHGQAHSAPNTIDRMLSPPCEYPGPQIGMGQSPLPAAHAKLIGPGFLFLRLDRDDGAAVGAFADLLVLVMRHDV